MELKAQTSINIENIIIDSKLRNNNIICIQQDEQGFLWIGTDWGLYKYDGYTFKEYLVTTNPSIIHNNVKSLLLEGNNLWIGTKGGISILNTENNTIIASYSSKDSVLADNYVTKIIKDKKEGIWVTYATNKISKYLGNNQFQHFNILTEGIDELFKVTEIIETTSNVFYLKMVCETTNVFAIVEAKIIDNIIRTTLIKQTTEDVLFFFSKKDTPYLIESNKLFKYNVTLKKLEFQRELFQNNEDFAKISTVYKDAKANIFVGTKINSFYNLNNKTFEPENIVYINQEKSWINSFFIDNSNLMWVATTGGLFKIKNNPILFKKYLYEKSVGNRNKMRSIIQDKEGAIYAVNQKALFKYDTILNKFKNQHWIVDEKIANPYALLEYDEYSFLVGTQNSGINIYDKKANTSVPFLKSYQTLSSNHVTKLLKDEQDILWIGTLDGLHYYDKKHDSLLKVVDNDSINSVEIQEIVHDIKTIKPHEFWVGTSTGLYYLNVNDSVFPLKINIKKIEKVPYTIRCLYIENNIIWVATQTNGVVKYNIINEETELIDTSDGLSDNTVYSILKGDENELWIGTFNGLSRYAIDQNQFLNYYEYNGLANNEFNSSSQLKASNGDLYFGGQNGISVVDLNKFKSDSTSYKLNVSSVYYYDSKNDKNIEIGVDNTDLQQIALPNNPSFLTFEFSLTDYFEPKNNIYKYKVLGLQNEWSVLNNSNVLTFTNFPSGEYVLEVMASTNYGNWNKETILLPIKVEEIYYKTWWFFASWGILTFLLFYVFRRYELNNIKKMEKLRLRISKDLHDELGSALTGIAIRTDLINENIDEETKNKFLKEISIESRSAVDSLSDIVWALDSTNNSIQDLYDRMESILFKLLTPLKIRYFFTPYEVNKNLGLKPDDKQQLFLIFKEAITNIVKHSNATFVDVTITKEVGKLKLKIHDNGTVFKNEKHSLNGKGIKNMKLRADKMNSELKITINKGFIIELWFDYSIGKTT